MTSLHHVYFLYVGSCISEKLIFFRILYRFFYGLENVTLWLER